MIGGRPFLLLLLVGAATSAGLGQVRSKCLPCECTVRVTFERDKQPDLHTLSAIFHQALMRLSRIKHGRRGT